MADEKGVTWLSMSDGDLARKIGELLPREGELPQLAAVVQIRSARAAEHSAEASRATAQWTKWLAVATVLLVAVTALFSYRAMDFQGDTLREMRRQNCLAVIDLTLALGRNVALPAETVGALDAAVQRCQQ